MFSIVNTMCMYKKKKQFNEQYNSVILHVLIDIIINSISNINCMTSL